MEFTAIFRSSSILHVPLQSYQKDFTFIVNNKEIKTSRFVADLLSPKISRYHLIDPTFCEYNIDTNCEGDFEAILNLLSFKTQSFSVKDLSFISQIIDELEMDENMIKINFNNNINTETTQKDIIDQLIKHQQYPKFFKEQIQQEVAHITSHFNELSENETKKLSKINDDILEEIVSNLKLQLETEDQLLTTINNLYNEDDKYSYLYQYVQFKNVTVKTMNEFLTSFKIEHLNRETWESLSKRLSLEVIKEKEDEMKRYKPKFKNITYEKDNFQGIIHHFKQESKIDDEVDITCSSVSSGEPKDIIDFGENSQDFYTQGIQNSWICFEFKKHTVKVANYTIRSYNSSTNCHHLRNWVIEGSNDKSEWTIIDEQKDNQYLNGPKYVHSFSINKEKENNQPFKYLRLRQTGPNWINSSYLQLNCIELYGQIF